MWPSLIKQAAGFHSRPLQRSVLGGSSVRIFGAGDSRSVTVANCGDSSCALPQRHSRTPQTPHRTAPYRYVSLCTPRLRGRRTFRGPAESQQLPDAPSSCTRGLVLGQESGEFAIGVQRYSNSGELEKSCRTTSLSCTARRSVSGGRGDLLQQHTAGPG